MENVGTAAVEAAVEFCTEEYCELVSREDTQDNIELKNGEIKILNGGQIDTNVQVELYLDLSCREVRIKCLSNNPCTAGGIVLNKDQHAIIGPGAMLVLGERTHVIFFGKRVVNSSNTVSVKRPFIGSHGDNTKKSNTQQTLKSFFSKSRYTACKWRKTDSLLIMTYGNPTPSSLIASFDLDGTITETKSGRLPFMTTPDDWRFLYRCISKKLHTIHSAGYKLVIFTNQGGMNYGNPLEEDFKLKLQAVMESLGDISVVLFAAINDDNYRKPGTGMWEYFIKNENGGVMVDIEQSYFIGDAAGRVRNWKKGCKKDFSCSDRKFAANTGIPFHTPDEFFLGELPSQDFSWEGFNPFALDYNLKGPLLEPINAPIVSPSQELVIFIGCPASGKTTFYQTHMSKQYSHINRDTLGTTEKCVSETNKVLKIGRCVVIDNTNPDTITRKRYIEMAKTIDSSIKIRCFVFQTPVSQCYHNNRYRELTTRDSDYKKLSNIAFDYYQSKHEIPTLEEGFDQIVNITINMTFNNTRLEKMYKQFYN